MKIGPLFIMVTALAAVVAASAAIGALLGMLIAFLLAADMSSAAPNWGTRRRLHQLHVPAERRNEWGRKGAVKPAERKQLVWKL